jgi:site-specific recombinase
LGAISRLAEKHGLSRQNVSKMLEGEFGKPERLAALVADAIFIIEEDMAEKKEKFSYLKRQLKKNLQQRAASS